MSTNAGEAVRHVPTDSTYPPARGSADSALPSRCRLTRRCPSGTTCSGRGEVESVDGFFISSWDPLKVELCDPASHCLANNSCADGWRGAFCAECAAGSNCFGDCVSGVCWRLVALIVGPIVVPIVIVMGAISSLSKSTDKLVTVMRSSRRSRNRVSRHMTLPGGGSEYRAVSQVDADVEGEDDDADDDGGGGIPLRRRENLPEWDQINLDVP
jgi:hypothetical protein